MSDSIAAALDCITYGVQIIGVKGSRQTNGMTAAWVTQVSREPPMVLVAVGKTHYTSELIPEAKCFSVNILKDTQFELAQRCGFGTGRNNERLAGLPIIYESTGAPIVSDCAAYLDCRLVHTFDIGSCMLFVGEVVAARSSSASVLAYDVERFFGKR